MPNFTPLRDYTFALADELISKHGLKSPFVDAGCGQGAFAHHLALRHGWHGLAADGSAAAVAVAEKRLLGTAVRVEQRSIEELAGSFNTVALTTVIEHINDDAAAVAALRRLLPDEPGQGHLIISMPTNPGREWRWDDDFYGHYRRYTRADVEVLLAGAGFQLLEFWDYTFPAFWGMRRVYTRVLPAKPPPHAVPEVNSAESSLSSAWSTGSESSVLAKVPVWGLVSSIQRRFREGSRGFEVIALAVTA